MTRRNVGDVERISATNIRNVSGVITDPTTLTLKVKKPGVAVVSYVYGGGVVLKDSTGNYHADLTLDTEGTWAYSWTGTGAAAFNEGGKMYVHPDPTA